MTSAKANSAKTLIITLVRSTASRPGKHRKIIAALGLGKLNSTVSHSDTPTIRGMVAKVPHLVSVTEA